MVVPLQMIGHKYRLIDAKKLIRISYMGDGPRHDGIAIILDPHGQEHFVFQAQKPNVPVLITKYCRRILHLDMYCTVESISYFKHNRVLHAYKITTPSGTRKYSIFNLKQFILYQRQ
jgi:hypothetical protein